MTKAREYKGLKFGDYTVIERTEAPDYVKNKRSAFWLIKCDKCEDEKVTTSSRLTNGDINVCRKCKVENNKIEREKWKKDNIELVRFKRIWYGIKERCKPEWAESQWYYDKGIKVCDRWFEFENFKEDMFKDYIEFEKEHGENSATIDRIDSDKGYSTDNCKWATYTEQARNRSSNIKIELNGIKYNTLTELGEAYGIKQSVIISRYGRGKRGLDLVKTPRKSPTKKQ
ncbi:MULTISPECIES: hypothetical protein [Lysinibacillus]|uniref:hypothetical protein n=1 Tax=Lysinibacillus TaxID=400634 RepID=UPI00214C66DD|nr:MULTISPECIES: hypothetical protein [Lysinibacillus]UUV25877.1 hypothetical protein NP781_04475 [Lysinibacillus sp. FN11]UYB48750.1 hypothetical protein OCI51_07265 [Lysinibacillus capsici]